MNDLLSILCNQIYDMVNHKVKGIVKTWYSDGTIYIKIIQNFSFHEKVEDAAGFFQTCTVDDFVKNILMKKYRAFVLNQYIYREQI